MGLAGVEPALIRCEHRVGRRDRCAGHRDGRPRHQLVACRLAHGWPEPEAHSRPHSPPGCTRVERLKGNAQQHLRPRMMRPCNVKASTVLAIEENMELVGDRLDKAMLRAGITSQSALSKKSGVPQPTIARILKNHGKGAPESATVKKLAAACGVSFNWLNEGSEEVPNQILSVQQIVWLELLNYLGEDDIREFETEIRMRQERNKRLLKEYKLR